MGDSGAEGGLVRKDAGGARKDACGGAFSSDGGEGIRTCIAWCGIGMDVHACDACRPSLLAMGDPRGAARAATGAGCGVFCLSEWGRGCRPPLWRVSGWAFGRPDLISIPN